MTCLERSPPIMRTLEATSANGLGSVIINHQQLALRTIHLSTRARTVPTNYFHPVSTHIQ